jgi:hypothetical protein
MGHNEKSHVVHHDDHHDLNGDVSVEEAAIIADGAAHIKPSPWTLSMLRLYGCLLIGYLCATTNGFDGAVMGFVASSPLKVLINLYKRNQCHDLLPELLSHVSYPIFSSNVDEVLITLKDQRVLQYRSHLCDL